MYRFLARFKFVFVFLISSFCYAGSDPVSWGLTPAEGFSPTPVGQQSVISYILTNRLPFSATLSTHYFTQGGSFSGVDFCRNKTLAPYQTCDIYAGFSPSSANTSSLRLMYGYHRNQIPLPTLVAQGVSQGGGGGGGGGGGTGFIQGTVSNLPIIITLNPLQQPIFTITYQNTGDAAVTGYAGNSGGLNLLSVSPSSMAGVTVQTNGCGTVGTPVTLQPQGTCQITGQITPTGNGTGLLTVSGLFTYNSGASTATPSSRTFIIQGTGSCIISAAVTLPLPATIYQYSDNVVQYQFTNSCSSAVALGTVSVQALYTPNSGQTATVTVGTDNCSNQTLSAGGSCTVLVALIPSGIANSISLEASVTAGGGTAMASTAATLQANDNNRHMVHFVNQCPFTVWYGIANGVIGSGNSPDPTPGSQINGAPPSAYQLNPQVTGIAPSTIDLFVYEYEHGAIWPRTGCQMVSGQFQCNTGYCATIDNSSTAHPEILPSATCVKLGNNFAEPTPPTTKFEFFIVRAPGGDGVYDVSVINGFNTPVEVKGLGPITGPFVCTGPGAPIQPAETGLGPCSWEFSPSSTGITTSNVLWVEDGGDNACSSCPGGTACGMAFNSFPYDTPINQRCGKFLGYWTLADYIGYSSNAQWGSNNLYTYYGMGALMTAISSQNYANTPSPCGGEDQPVCTPAIFANLFGCIPTTNDGADTCYSNSPATTCCGCVDWPFTAASKSCGNFNSDWLNIPTGLPVSVQQAVTWLKQACPTAYAYQFDDPSSSYQCLKDATGKAMRTSYQIVFCPGGKTGLPPGVTDGRISS